MVIFWRISMHNVMLVSRLYFRKLKIKYWTIRFDKKPKMAQNQQKKSNRKIRQSIGLKKSRNETWKTNMTTLIWCPIQVHKHYVYVSVCSTFREAILVPMTSPDQQSAHVRSVAIRVPVCTNRQTATNCTDRFSTRDNTSEVLVLVRSRFG